MKCIVVAFILLLVGVSAKPQDDIDDGSATNKIKRFIESIRHRLVGAGLDPLEVHNFSFETVSRLGSSHIWIKGLLVHGLSNIMVESLTFDVATSKLRLALVMPRISYAAESMGVELDVLGHQFSAKLGGSLDILAMRIVNNLHINVSLDRGVSVRSSEVEFSIQNVKSNLRVRVQGRDLSDKVNRALGVTIPNKLRSRKHMINGLLSAATHRVLDHVL